LIDRNPQSDTERGPGLGLTIYLVVVGLLLLAAAWVAIVKDSAAAAAALAVLAGGALIVAPFSPYLEGRLKIGAVELTLRQRVIEAVKTAPLDEVEGVLPILESEAVGVRQFPVPSAFEGKSLTGDELSFLRQERKLSVIAIRPPAESHWLAGGEISDMPIRAGATLLVAGPRAALERFADEYATDR
jgi:hypothetical protein